MTNKENKKIKVNIKYKEKKEKKTKKEKQSDLNENDQNKNKKRYIKQRKKSEKQHKPPLSERIRLSLALKLSMKSFWRSIAVFFCFNFVLLVLILGFFIYSSSESLNSTKNEIDGIDTTDYIVINPSMEKVKNKDMAEDYITTNWDSITKQSAIPDNLEEYYFQLYITKDGTSILPIISIPECGAYTRLNSGDYLIFSFTPFLKIVVFFLAAVMIFEFLSIMNGLFVMSKRIKKTLKPIQMLAESVHSINGYDADTRLYIPGTQNELVDLVAEINGLLDRIQDAYSAQNRFVSDASHELRTPISVIQGYADLLNRWGKQDEKTLNEGIAAIQNETRNMKNLVEQLLFLARSDHKTTKLEMTNFELSTLVNEVYHEAKMVDKDHEYTINAPSMVWIAGDMNLVKQLIRIFQENAKKYTPTGGNIKLEVLEEINTAVLVIQDDGIGIAPEDVEHIFDRFYRVDKSRARKEGGSGLGLAIADQIIRFHKGSVDVISREGLGTRIIVRLPLAPAPSAVPEPSGLRLDYEKFEQPTIKI